MESETENKKDLDRDGAEFDVAGTSQKMLERKKNRGLGASSHNSEDLLSEECEDSAYAEDFLSSSAYHEACLSFLEQEIEEFEAEKSALLRQQEQQEQGLHSTILESDAVFAAPGEQSGMNTFLDKTDAFTNRLGIDSISTGVVYKTGPDGEVAFYRFDPMEISPNLVPVDSETAQRIKDLYGDDPSSHAVSYDEYRSAQVKATEYGNTAEDPFAQDEKEGKLFTEIEAKATSLDINKDKLEALNEKIKKYKEIVENGRPEDVKNFMKEEGLEHKVRNAMSPDSTVQQMASENLIGHDGQEIKSAFNALAQPQENNSPAGPAHSQTPAEQAENKFEPTLPDGPSLS